MSESAPSSPPPPKRSHVGRLVTVFASIAAVAFMWSCASAHREPDSQETVVLGQTHWDAEGPASLRIHVRERESGHPIPDAKVSLRLQTDEGVKLPVADLRTDTQGTVAESLALPPLKPGTHTHCSSRSNPAMGATASNGRSRSLPPVDCS